MHVLKLFIKQLHFPLLRYFLLENKIIFHQNLVPYAKKSLKPYFRPQPAEGFNYGFLAHVKSFSFVKRQKAYCIIHEIVEFIFF
jgi:hypothetical protein